MQLDQAQGIGQSWPHLWRHVTGGEASDGGRNKWVDVGCEKNRDARLHRIRLPDRPLKVGNAAPAIHDCPDGMKGDEVPDRTGPIVHLHTRVGIGNGVKKRGPRLPTANNEPVKCAVGACDVHTHPCLPSKVVIRRKTAFRMHADWVHDSVGGDRIHRRCPSDLCCGRRPSADDCESCLQIRHRKAWA